MSGQFLRRFLIAGIGVTNSDKIISHKCDPVCRASELPIYIYEQNAGKKEVNLCPPPPSLLESTVGSVRKGIVSLYNIVTMQRQKTEECFREGKSRATSMVTYLSEESDEKTRIGAVGLGAVAGYLMGLRGGLFKRLIYTSTGTVIMCAVCYPKQTYEYSQTGLAQTKKYAKITYNFIYGVNGTKQAGEELQLPKLPTSIDEVWQMVNQFSKSTSAMITGKQEQPLENKDDTSQEKLSNVKQ